VIFQGGSKVLLNLLLEEAASNAGRYMGFSGSLHALVRYYHRCMFINSENKDACLLVKVKMK